MQKLLLDGFVDCDNPKNADYDSDDYNDYNHDYNHQYADTKKKTALPYEERVFCYAAFL